VNEAINLLNDLKFFGMKEALIYRLGEAAKGNLGHLDFFNLLLDDERLYRQNQRSNKLRKRAKFKDSVCLEEFECAPKRGVNKGTIQQLKSLYFLEKNENLIFIGGTGAGKSFLAQAIGHAVCLAGIESYFISVNRLFKEIEAAEVDGSYLTLMQRLSRFKLLILDDFGLRNYSHKEAGVLYEIFEDRYQKGSTIMTSQVKCKGWELLIEDKVMAEAIFDRIMACSQIIELKGPSFRENHKSKINLEIEGK